MVYISCEYLQKKKNCRVVENHKLINLVLFNWLMTSYCPNDVIIVNIFSFYKNLTNQNKNVLRRF